MSPEPSISHAERSWDGSTELYFVETRSEEQRLLLCQWAEHFYEKGYRVYILTDSTTASQHIDQLLWTFSELSFVPHRVYSGEEPQEIEDPVVIGAGERFLEGFGVLLCDAPVGLDFICRFPLVVHFVILDDENQRQFSRALYRDARQRRLGVYHIPYSSNHPTTSSKTEAI